MKKKIAYGVTGLILGCIFLFPIYILIMNSFKTTKGIFTDVLGFPAKGTFTLENYKNELFGIIRSVEAEAKRLGESGLALLNKYAIRTTDFKGGSRSPLTLLDRLA